MEGIIYGSEKILDYINSSMERYQELKTALNQEFE